MLQRLSAQVRACHERAAEAKSKAEATADPAVKVDFLEMERRWLALARSHAYTESLGDFTAAMSGTRPKPDDALRLQEISTLLIQEGNIDALYDRVLDAAIGLMRADMGSMQAFQSERNELDLIAWRGFHPESAVFWKSVRLDSASTCAVALSAGRLVMVPDIEACDF